jgi:hypothetical protein
MHRDDRRSLEDNTCILPYQQRSFLEELLGIDEAHFGSTNEFGEKLLISSYYPRGARNFERL